MWLLSRDGKNATEIDVEGVTVTTPKKAFYPWGTTAKIEEELEALSSQVKENSEQIVAKQFGWGDGGTTTAIIPSLLGDTSGTTRFFDFNLPEELVNAGYVFSGVFCIEVKNVNLSTQSSKQRVEALVTSSFTMNSRKTLRLYVRAVSDENKEITSISARCFLIKESLER